MFNFFKKKSYKPPITIENQEWVEEKFIWLIESFGLEKIKKEAFILPSEDNFSQKDFIDTQQFNELFAFVCQKIGLDPQSIATNIFNDLHSKTWHNLRPIPYSSKEDILGLYYNTYRDDENKFHIDIAKSLLTQPIVLVDVLAHELMHVKLLGYQYMSGNGLDMELLTDLACIYFGFGIFAANAIFHSKTYDYYTKIGYLNESATAYANALICKISKTNPDKIFHYFSENADKYFRQSIDYLNNTSHFDFQELKMNKADLIFQSWKKIEHGFKNKDIELVIDACQKLLLEQPKNLLVLNNLGYAMILSENYKEAIGFFNKAVAIDSFFDYPFNNRGFCKLQLGDLEGALVDMETAWEMNSENSYVWRNLGIYYLVVNELDKSLEYLEKAMEMDKETEDINYYLGKIHQVLGNDEKANFFFKKSKEAKELMAEKNLF